MRTAQGLSTEAVYIFHNMVRKLVTSHNPEYIAAIFESQGPTFRDEAFSGYKANRTETPPDLLDQIPWIRRTLEAMRIPVFEYDKFEADDVIGTIARRAADAGQEVVIVSSDKDMLQLVGGPVAMYNPMKEDTWFDEAATVAYMGVKPVQVADLLALKGDSIDNIPGAPGIGDKGARDLILRFGTVEAAIEHAAEVERKTYRESLQNNREQILLSKKLATIEKDVPIEWDLESAARHEPDNRALRELYKTLEFTSLLRELAAPQDQAPREYPTLESDAELEDWLASIPPEAPLAIAAGGDMMGETTIGIAHPGGAARTIRPTARATVAHDIKSIIRRFGDSPALQHDTLLYSFLLTADPGSADLDVLAERRLDIKPAPDPASRAECILALYQILRPEVEAAGLLDVYEKIDLPMSRVLARMEDNGIRVEPEGLHALASRMEEEIARIGAEIYELAGKNFNINSPQQLAKVLFEDLGLPQPTRYGRGRVMSTAADVLEDLAAEHPIAGKVLEYRQLTKLKGTYVDALPAMIDPRDGRLHTSFNLAGAATGRLSSANPNLQNIPIRTELGRQIRAAFVPQKGWKLIVADYSQIELRLLAHMSGDPVLVDAFRNGEDIHTRTAAEVFGVPPLMITPDQRRNAKAVNFGIVYGQTPFGLAQQLGIDRKEAEIYIRAYFERYAGVRRFIDQTIAEVRRSGIARTLLGRRRPIPDMNSRNPNARGFAERTAVNTPLQGTAADLIKMAMIRIDERLRGRSARLLLQVHDELVLEAPPHEVDEVRLMVKAEMENVFPLDVPLLADAGIGDNWRDAK